MNDCERCQLEDTDQCKNCHTVTTSRLVKDCKGKCDMCLNGAICEENRSKVIDMIEITLKEIIDREEKRISSKTSNNQARGEIIDERRTKRDSSHKQ